MDQKFNKEITTLEDTPSLGILLLIAVGALVSLILIYLVYVSCRRYFVPKYKNRATKLTKKFVYKVQHMPLLIGDKRTCDRMTSNRFDGVIVT